MTRRTYGIMTIARRHPRLFAAMHPVREQARVVRGEPYLWACVSWRTDKPARRRDEPRASRFSDLEQA